MNPIRSSRTGYTLLRAAVVTAGANVVLAGVAAATALARGGGGSHSFSSHSSGGSSHIGSVHSSGHFIYHNGHYFYTSSGYGSHVSGGLVTAIVLGSIALAFVIPLTIWLVRRTKAAGEAAVHAAEDHHNRYRQQPTGV